MLRKIASFFPDERMLYLLNQFDLKPNITRAEFDVAWADFAAHLVSTELAAEVGPILERQHASGFDTDAARPQSMFAVIRFADDAQADKAWQAIETATEPLGTLHRNVFRLVHDPVFSFWKQG